MLEVNDPQSGVMFRDRCHTDSTRMQASAPPTPPLRRFENLAGEEWEIVLLPTVTVSLFHEVKKGWVGFLCVTLPCPRAQR